MEFVTINQAAEIMKISRRTLEMKMEQHLIPFYYSGSRRVLCREEIEDIIKATRVPTVHEVEQKMHKSRTSA